MLKGVKALYGLKLSAMCWHHELDQTLVVAAVPGSLSYVMDYPGSYTKRGQIDHITMNVYIVDDLVVAG